MLLTEFTAFLVAGWGSCSREQGNRMNVCISEVDSLSCRNVALLPEGAPENSPRWSVAQPWEPGQLQIFRPVGQERDPSAKPESVHAIALQSRDRPRSLRCWFRPVQMAGVAVSSAGRGKIRSRSTRRSVDATTSMRRPASSSSTTSPVSGIRPSISLTRPPSVVAS